LGFDWEGVSWISLEKSKCFVPGVQKEGLKTAIVFINCFKRKDLFYE